MKKYNGDNTYIVVIDLDLVYNICADHTHCTLHVIIIIIIIVNNSNNDFR